MADWAPKPQIPPLRCGMTNKKWDDKEKGIGAEFWVVPQFEIKYKKYPMKAAPTRK
jgi:hypothetical protein